MNPVTLTTNDSGHSSNPDQPHSPPHSGHFRSGSPTIEYPHDGQRPRKSSPNPRSVGLRRNHSNGLSDESEIPMQVSMTIESVL